MAEKKSVPEQSGYKIVDCNLQALGGFQYEVGKIASQPGRLKMYDNGLHYTIASPAICYNAIGGFRPPLRYLRVTPQSEVISTTTISVTLKLHVDAELKREEWIGLIRRQLDNYDYPEAKLDPASIQDIRFILYAAACENDIESINRCIKLKAPIDSRIFCGAALFNHLTTLEYLFERHRLDKYDLNHVLDDASAFANAETAALLMRHGADDVDMAMVTAASTGNISLMQFLETKGAKVANDSMEAAAAGGHLDSLIWLVRHGGQIRIRQIGIATAAKHCHIINYLLVNGAGFTNTDLNPIFIAAAKDNDVPCMHLLHEAGADAVEAAFRAACGASALNAMRFAVDKGAACICSVLIHAVGQDNKRVVQFLATMGAISELEQILKSAKRMLQPTDSAGPR